MKSRTGMQAWLAPALVAAWSSVAAWAEGGLEEIIVTAQKRPDSLMDVPMAVSAFTGDELTTLGVADSQQLQFSVPAVVFPNTASAYQPYIRGVGSRLLLNGLEPSVGIYLDNRYVARQTSVLFDMADIERVEVLKGPQGVLFGRNSSAGAIRVITKEVADGFEGSASLGYGNYAARVLSGVINLPVTDDLGMRFSLKRKQRDGYADNLVPGAPIDEFDDEDYQGLRGRAKWRVSDNAVLDFSINYFTRDDTAGSDIVALGPAQYHGGIAQGGATGREVDEVASLSRYTNDQRELSTELKASLALAGFDLVSITTTARYDSVLAFEGDGTSAVLVDAQIPESGRALSQELQMLSTADGSHTWMLGAFFFNDDAATYEAAYDGIALSRGNQAVDTTAWALFGQLRWQFATSWGLTAGGRYSWDRKAVAYDDTDVLPGYRPFPGAVGRREHSADWAEFTPGFTVDYLLGPGMVYATYARGFKSGGYNYPLPNPASALDPETLDMVEVGYKGDALGDTLRITSALYHYDYRDLQITRAASVGSAVVTSENAAKASLQGLEVDVTWLAADNLTIAGAISFQHSEYVDFLTNAKVYLGVLNNSAATGLTDYGFDASGERLLRAPEIAGMVSISYDIPIPGAILPLSVAYSYKGDYDFDFSIDPTTRQLRQEAYGLVNARLGWEPLSGQWRAALWVNNLTDERYFADVVAAFVGLRGSYGAPRTFGIDLSYQF